MRPLVPAIMALLALPAAATAHPLCQAAGHIGANTAYLHQTGAPQTQAARAAAQSIETVVNSPEARRALSNAERHELSQYMADVATHIVQVVYSTPVEQRREEKANAVMAAKLWVEESCNAHLARMH